MYGISYIFTKNCIWKQYYVAIKIMLSKEIWNIYQSSYTRVHDFGVAGSYTDTVG